MSTGRRRHMVRSMAWLLMAAVVASPCACNLNLPGGSVNPFTDLPPIPLNGISRDLPADITPLGELEAGRVIRVRVDGAAVTSVQLLIADDVSDESGVIVGAGRPNQSFDYRVMIPGRYFVFVQFAATVPQSLRQATITAGPGDASFVPPSRQVVLVTFEDGYLSNPGLFDPVDGTDENREFLEGISQTVAEGIVDRLRTIYAGTPIEIITASDPLPGEAFSRLIFRPERVLASDQDFFDAALPPLDPSFPQCNQRVTFGEVLPSGTAADEGNLVRDDEAVVYVGSFQGRGQECWTSAINSVNNVILTLSQTGAHEIGHLVGLLHVEQIDLMNRSATLAFLRELGFTRGQIQTERLVGGEVVVEVLTTVIQDPAIYFQANFASP